MITLRRYDFFMTWPPSCQGEVRGMTAGRTLRRDAFAPSPVRAEASWLAYRACGLARCGYGVISAFSGRMGRSLIPSGLVPGFLRRHRGMALKTPFPLVSGPMIVDIPPLPVRKRWLAVTTTRGLVRAKSPCLFILPLCGDRKSMVLHSLSLRRLTPKCQENRISALAEAENRPGGKNGGEAQQGQQVRAKVRQGAALEKDRPHRFHEVA